MSMWAKPYHQFSRVYMAKSMFDGMKEFDSCMEIIVVNEEESRRLIFSVDRIADPSPRAIITDWICDALYNFKFPCMVSWRPSYLYTNHNIKWDNSKVIGDDKWLLKDGYKDDIWAYLRDGRVLCGTGWTEWIQFPKLGEAISYLDERAKAADIGYGMEFLIWSQNHLGRGCIVLKSSIKSLVNFLINSFLGFSCDAVAVKTREVAWKGTSKIGVKHQIPGNVLSKEQFFARIQNETAPFNVQDQADAPAIGPRPTPLRLRERLTCEHCKGFHRSGDCLKTPPKSTPPKGILKKATPSPGTFRKASEMFPKRGRKGSSSSEATPIKRQRVVGYLKKGAPKSSKDGPSTSQALPPRKRGRPAKQKANEQLAKVVKYEKEDDENDGEILSEGEEEEDEEEETSFIVHDEEDEMSWSSMEEMDESEDDE